MMKNAVLLGSLAASLCLGLAAPVSAAPPASPATPTGPTDGHVVVGASPAAGPVALKPAEVCLADVRAFNSQMQKDGYWRGGSDYGYGYPMGGYGYGYGVGYPMGGYPTGTGYQDARPGYELRSLLTAANILAQKGQQQSCEDVLATGRGIYKVYAADLRTRGVNNDEGPSWQQQQISAAVPVAGTDMVFRSVQLIDADVRTPQDVALGSIHDLVMSPKTGKLAYVVIGRGGIFGIDETYIPVPWDDFKTTPNATLLVLDTTKAILEAAPTVKDSQFSTPGAFEKESAAVDAYWHAHIAKAKTN